MVNLCRWPNRDSLDYILFVGPGVAQRMEDGVTALRFFFFCLSKVPYICEFFGHPSLWQACNNNNEVAATVDDSFELNSSGAAARSNAAAYLGKHCLLNNQETKVLTN